MQKHMIQTIRITIIGLFLFFGQHAFAQNADALLGIWKTEGGKSHVEIFKKGGQYFGKIVWLREPTNEDGSKKVDENNPDSKLQSRPIMGMELLSDFSYDADDSEWGDGEIYDPESGKTYSCVMKLANDKLDVRGFVGFSWIGRTTTWTRVP